MDYCYKLLGLTKCFGVYKTKVIVETSLLTYMQAHGLPFLKANIVFPRRREWTQTMQTWAKDVAEPCKAALPHWSKEVQKSITYT